MWVVRLVDDNWCVSIGVQLDVYVEWDFVKERCVNFFCFSFCVVMVENVVVCVVVWVDEMVYVFDNVEDWNFDFVEYVDGFVGVDQCQILWC